MQPLQTVGDLWKALHEGMEVGPSEQLDWVALDRALALCYAEGGDRAEAMRKLIARVALANGVDRREIVNMPLARFIDYLEGGV